MPTLLRVSHEENPLPSEIVTIFLEGPLQDLLVPSHGCTSTARMMVGLYRVKESVGFQSIHFAAQGLRSLSAKIKPI